MDWHEKYQPEASQLAINLNSGSQDCKSITESAWLCCLLYYASFSTSLLVLHYQWWIQGRPPRSFLDQTGAGRAKNVFSGDQAPPPYLRLWITRLLSPPPPSPPYLHVWICHWLPAVRKENIPLLLCGGPEQSQINHFQKLLFGCLGMIYNSTAFLTWKIPDFFHLFIFKVFKLIFIQGHQILA